MTFHLNRIRARVLTIYKQQAAIFSPKDPVYIFHHLPKCGGTSINKILDSWFITVRDYRLGRTEIYPDKVNLDALRSAHCLSGHFELEGFYLHQRYPELFKSNRYKVFTFIRDPLEVQMSLYRYENKAGVSKVRNIEDHLKRRKNYLANLFPATLENYKEVINRYFFIGIIDYPQKSIDMLSAMIGKKSREIPWMNRTIQVTGEAFGGNSLSQDVIDEFKSDNALDYLIYEYCIEKFNNTVDEKK